MSPSSTSTGIDLSSLHDDVAMSILDEAKSKERHGFAENLQYQGLSVRVDGNEKLVDEILSAQKSGNVPAMKKAQTALFEDLLYKFMYGKVPDETTPLAAASDRLEALAKSNLGGLLLPIELPKAGKEGITPEDRKRGFLVTGPVAFSYDGKELEENALKVPTELTTFGRDDNPFPKTAMSMAMFSVAPRSRDDKARNPLCLVEDFPNSTFYTARGKRDLAAVVLHQPDTTPQDDDMFLYVKKAELNKVLESASQKDCQLQDTTRNVADKNDAGVVMLPKPLILPPNHGLKIGMFIPLEDISSATDFQAFTHAEIERSVDQLIASTNSSAGNLKSADAGAIPSTLPQSSLSYFQDGKFTPISKEGLVKILKQQVEWIVHPYINRYFQVVKDHPDNFFSHGWQSHEQVSLQLLALKDENIPTENLETGWAFSNLVEHMCWTLALAYAWDRLYFSVKNRESLRTCVKEKTKEIVTLASPNPLTSESAASAYALYIYNRTGWNRYGMAPFVAKEGERVPRIAEYIKSRVDATNNKHPTAPEPPKRSSPETTKDQNPGKYIWLSSGGGKNSISPQKAKQPRQSSSISDESSSAKKALFNSQTADSTEQYTTPERKKVNKDTTSERFNPMEGHEAFVTDHNTGETDWLTGRESLQSSFDTTARSVLSLPPTAFIPSQQKEGKCFNKLDYKDYLLGEEALSWSALSISQLYMNGILIYASEQNTVQALAEKYYFHTILPPSRAFQAQVLKINNNATT